MDICLCVYVCVDICLCMRECGHLSVCGHLSCVYVRLCVRLCVVCLCVCVDICVYVLACVSVSVWACTCKCVSLLFCNFNVYHFHSYHYCSIWHGYTVHNDMESIGIVFFNFMQACKCCNIKDFLCQFKCTNLKVNQLEYAIARDG